MTKKQIKKLADFSFIKNNLDLKSVKKFVGKMKRSELREYLKYLKTKIAEKNIYVFAPNLENLDKIQLQKDFSKLFPNKKIVYKEDPELLLGLKVIDNDRIFDFNLKNSFDSMTNYIKDL